MSEAEPPLPRASRQRMLVGVGLVALAAALAAFAIERERHEFVDAIDRIGAGAMSASLVAGLVATGANFPIWRTVVRGLGVRMPFRVEARAFFVSQLGKYLPGAIWPVVMQSEVARRNGASRRVVVAANLITMAIGCTIGLLIACVLLPTSGSDALKHYWWVLLALPFLLVVLHPRVAPAVVNRALRLAGRAPIDIRLGIRSASAAGLWSAVSWIALGVHVAVLGVAVSHTTWTVIAICVGGAPLAVVAGIFAVPVPAGVGIRDSVLGVVLAIDLSAGAAIAVVVASRVLLIVVDLLLAAVTLVRRTPLTAAA